jgi:hypothetical protein
MSTSSLIYHDTPAKPTLPTAPTTLMSIFFKGPSPACIDQEIMTHDSTTKSSVIHPKGSRTTYILHTTLHISLSGI